MARIVGLIYLVPILIGSLLEPVLAHEVRPAYLEIRETSPDLFAVLWKTPARGEASIRLDVVLPTGCADRVPPVSFGDGAANVLRRSVRCEGGLAGKEIRIDGLDRTLVEAIVRIERLDAGAQSLRLMSGSSALAVAESPGLITVAAVYLPFGVEHILLGFDHLCFVLALLLLIKELRRLAWAITAFTAAHSVTLAMATLGVVSLPPGPIEALIAFSIALVAAECLYVQRGQPSPTATRPWTIALVFGLLHGFGFAGALTQAGLPADAIPAALLFFNIGVELGQLAFVALVLGCFWLLRNLVPKVLRPAVQATAYGIGSLAAFWTIERLSGIFV